MDIHKNFTQACAVNEKGKIVKERRFSSDIKGIESFIHHLPEGERYAAIESTCTWYHMYEKLTALNVEATLVNVRRTKVIAESKIKTDKLDARSLSQCLRTGFIATAYIPPKHVMERRDILQHYISLGRDLARQKIKIQAILLRNGIKHHFSDLFGKAGMTFLKDLKLRRSEGYRLKSYLRIVETLLNERKHTKRKIIALCRQNKQAMLLSKSESCFQSYILLSK